MARFTAFGPTFAIKIVSKLQKSFQAPGFAFENLDLPILVSKIKIVVGASSYGVDPCFSIEVLLPCLIICQKHIVTHALVFIT